MAPIQIRLTAEQVQQLQESTGPGAYIDLTDEQMAQLRGAADAASTVNAQPLSTSSNASQSLSASPGSAATSDDALPPAQLAESLGHLTQLVQQVHGSNEHIHNNLLEVVNDIMDSQSSLADSVTTMIGRLDRLSSIFTTSTTTPTSSASASNPRASSAQASSPAQVSSSARASSSAQASSAARPSSPAQASSSTRTSSSARAPHSAQSLSSASASSPAVTSPAIPASSSAQSSSSIPASPIPASYAAPSPYSGPTSALVTTPSYMTTNIFPAQSHHHALTPNIGPLLRHAVLSNSSLRSLVASHMTDMMFNSVDVGALSTAIVQNASSNDIASDIATAITGAWSQMSTTSTSTSAAAPATSAASSHAPTPTTAPTTSSQSAPMSTITTAATNLPAPQNASPYLNSQSRQPLTCFIQTNFPPPPPPPAAAALGELGWTINPAERLSNHAAEHQEEEDEDN